MLFVCIIVSVSFYEQDNSQSRLWMSTKHARHRHELEPRRRAATPGPGESVSDMGACGVVGGAESARAM